MRPPSLPRALFFFFFFALLHPRNLPEGPSVVEAFSSSLDVCGVNAAVARASKLPRFTPSVSVHTRTHLDWVFVTSSLAGTSLACALVGKKKRTRKKKKNPR